MAQLSQPWHSVARLRPSHKPLDPRWYSVRASLNTVALSNDARNHLGALALSTGAGTHLEFPSGLAWHAGHLYVSDVFNHRVVCLDAELRPVLAFGSFGSAPGELMTSPSHGTQRCAV